METIMMALSNPLMRLITDISFGFVAIFATIKFMKFLLYSLDLSMFSTSESSEPCNNSEPLKTAETSHDGDNDNDGNNDNSDNGDKNTYSDMVNYAYSVSPLFAPFMALLLKFRPIRNLYLIDK